MKRAIWILHRVSKKLSKFVFVRTVSDFHQIWWFFGRKMRKRLELWEVHLFSTSPNLCHNTTMWNADVPNCHTMLLNLENSTQQRILTSSIQDNENFDGEISIAVFNASWFNTICWSFGNDFIFGGLPVVLRVLESDVRVPLLLLLSNDVTKCRAFGAVR